MGVAMKGKAFLADLRNRSKGALWARHGDECALLADAVEEADGSFRDLIESECVFVETEGAVVEGEVATTTDVATAPVIAVLEGAVPVTSLVISDVVAGSGSAVAEGATVTVEYCGVGLASGTVFDSSWARGEPATFPLSGVIAGWQDGIPGMQPGGRRLLVIPADLAYGDQPPPGSGIAPGESLIFVVDLVSSP